jgi:hypothetical protein
MFGRGLTRLQPAYVEDVAEAVTGGAATNGKTSHILSGIKACVIERVASIGAKALSVGRTSVEH